MPPKREYNDFLPSSIISFNLSGKSICACRSVSIFSRPIEVREKNIWRLSSWHKFLEIRFFFSAETITLEALEALSPNASATEPDESSPLSFSVHKSIASLMFTSNCCKNCRSNSTMARLMSRRRHMISLSIGHQMNKFTQASSARFM